MRATSKRYCAISWPGNPSCLPPRSNWRNISRHCAAKDILPLWRDAGATQPNLHPGLLVLLKQTYGFAVSVEDVAAYLYAVLAQPAFTNRFSTELATRELRAPITMTYALFRQAAGLGRTLLWLHSYGERFAANQPALAPVAKCLKAVPATALGPVPDQWRNAPKSNTHQHGLALDDE